MNNNIFSTNFNEDYMLLFPYNDHYSSQQLLPFIPSSSSINNISNTSNNHLDHHNQFLQAPSPYSQFDFIPDFTLLAYDDHNQTITTNDHHHHPPSLLPLNKPIEESLLIEPSETITHIDQYSQRISSTSHDQETEMKNIKKPSRADRHSKIKTAKGTRDRRMRLSLDVAKELFGLQDMLGFDKASKTVEWLLTQAKPEIIKIANSLTNNRFNHGGFNSDSESRTQISREEKIDGRSMRGKRKMTQPRTPILKKLSKEARAKARERAKDRTKEKMMMMKRRSQVNVVVEEEEAHDTHHDQDEIVIEEIRKKGYNISDESYGMINKLTHHCLITIAAKEMLLL
ncbi:unnamed protein product [Cochlearia groenlandica]